MLIRLLCNGNARPNEATVDRFADVADAAAFVAEWWENAEGRPFLAKKADSPFMGSSSGMAVDSSDYTQEACLSAFRNWVWAGRGSGATISYRNTVV